MNGGSFAWIGAACYFGDGVGSIGSFTLNDGTITTADGNQLEVGAWGGTGNFYQNGGTINNLDTSGGGINGDEAYYIGAYGIGTYHLAAGTLNSPWTNIGYGGDPGWAAPCPEPATSSKPAASITPRWLRWAAAGTTAETAPTRFPAPASLNADGLELAVMDWGRGAGGSDPWSARSTRTAAR